MGSLTTETFGNLTLIKMDDGKANALSPALLEELDGAFESAKDANAVILTGRDGCFSGGFDLKFMLAGADKARYLVALGGEFLMKLYQYPRPIVMACTGHALAGGALLAATGDIRIGARGNFKIGLNEVQAGIPVPILAERLAADRLDPRRFVQAVLHAELYDPDTAVDVGWLDQAVDAEQLLDVAKAEASRLGALPTAAYAKSKLGLRRRSIAYIRDTLESNLLELMSD